jgi:hypothetical protein
MSFWELLVLALLAALAVAAIITAGTRYVFGERTRLVSDDGGSPALRAITVVYALALAFVLETSLQFFNNAKQQTEAEADTVTALANLSRALPSPTGTQLRAELASYSSTVINREFPAMESGSVQIPDTNESLVHMYRTLAITNREDLNSAAAASLQTAFQQLSNLTTERDARVRAAGNSLPDVIWLLIIGGGIILMLAVAAVTYIDPPWTQFFALASVSVTCAIVTLVILSLQTPFVHNGFFVDAAPMNAALSSISRLPVF